MIAQSWQCVFSELRNWNTWHFKVHCKTKKNNLTIKQSCSLVSNITYNGLIIHPKKKYLGQKKGMVNILSLLYLMMKKCAGNFISPQFSRCVNRICRCTILHFIDPPILNTGWWRSQVFKQCSSLKFHHCKQGLLLFSPATVASGFPKSLYLPTSLIAIGCSIGRFDFLHCSILQWHHYKTKVHWFDWQNANKPFFSTEDWNHEF